MSSESMVISGRNRFSIRLAHARAITMLFDEVSKVNLDNFTFTVKSEREVNHKPPRQAFIDWCERLSEIEGNKVNLTVANE